ncbi:hypothetical protein [Microbulbifer thermotolerans]|uniref:hypothetical protein n=1 Tax=Microbulbifer thermotolerans TaxID=252514 RepID=UPI0008E3AFAF|nr:hypothetical protein [Microbulbifer thermotolerans]MCX2796353.1 hypothetical protein [Microbulbifer thermotolerans]MCX2833063.1 hypothetical protein [Microbulbifer thermotolerans]SFC97625.1 hypothetical protein SAMN05660479_02861 [Microbulbifer thermotolerans]
MQALTTRETTLLIEGGATVSNLKLVRVRHEGKRYYQIEFVLHARGTEKPSQLITTRNEPHRWADLNRAVAFVEQLFPDNDEIRLIIKSR